MPVKGRVVKGAAAGLVRTAAKRPPCRPYRPYLPSFPRKRESSGCLPNLRRHKAVPSGFPLAREGRLLYTIARYGEGQRRGFLRPVVNLFRVSRWTRAARTSLCSSRNCATAAGS